MEKLDDRDLVFLRSEHAALRQEVLLRIRMQHQILLSTWTAFGVLAAVALAWRRADPLVLYTLLATFSAASWQHSGARTVQLKTYLRDDLEPRLTGGHGEPCGGWEAALAGMRVRGLLGACWFVSTKGFLFGSQAVATLAFVLAPWLSGMGADSIGPAWVLALLLSLACHAATIWILRYPRLERAGH